MSQRNVYLIAAVVFAILTFATWGERSKRLWSYLFAILAIASGFMVYGQMQPPARPDASIDMPTDGN